MNMSLFLGLLAQLCTFTVDTSIYQYHGDTLPHKLLHTAYLAYFSRNG
jgi:hypothetical protein